MDRQSLSFPTALTNGNVVSASYDERPVYNAAGQGGNQPGTSEQFVNRSALHIVALSGGKDSTAMALRLVEVEPRDYIFVCTPTGDELPTMFEHWRQLGEKLEKPILPIMRHSLKGLTHQWNALPNWRQRWCTRAIKIEPYRE